MALIIVRPIEKFQETKQIFSDMTNEIYPCPVTRIIYLEPYDFPRHSLEAVAFTSEFAVHGLKNLGVKFPQYAYCIGKATGQVAKDYGISVVKVPDISDGVSLAGLIISDSKDLSKEIVYCAGVYRKKYFETRLQENHIDFKVFELYQAQEINSLTDEIQNLLLTKNKVSFLCFSSRSAVVLSKQIKAFCTSNPMRALLNWRIVGKHTEFDSRLLQGNTIQFFDSPDSLVSYVRNECLNG
jgi:uroporphyrinogen-III synthase